MLAYLIIQVAPLHQGHYGYLLPLHHLVEVGLVEQYGHPVLLYDSLIVPHHQDLALPITGLAQPHLHIKSHTLHSK